MHNILLGRHFLFSAQFAEKYELELIPNAVEVFSPTAASLEIFGSMTDSLHQLIQQLVQKAAERSNIPYSILFPYWCKRISMTVQRGNAKFWMEANVRMSGSDSLGDASVMLATHHIRTVAE